MKNFILSYFISLALLFGLLYAPIWEVSILLNEYQTKLTLYILKLFLNPNQLEGNAILIHSNYIIRINKSCNGMIPMLFLFASLIAYPSKIKPKIIWITVGYLLVNIVNITRILFVVFITQNGEGHQDFYWSHDIVGNTMLMGSGLLFFIGFIKVGSKK